MAANNVRAGGAYVELGIRDRLEKGLNAASKRLRGFAAGAGRLGAVTAGVGGAMLAPFGLAVSKASDLEETMSKFSVVFGQQTAATKAWSDSFADDIGRSKQEIASFMAGTQDLLVPMGVDPDVARETSKVITQLTVDLGSFNNRADADVMNDLQAALTGSGEVMKKYGVVLNEAAVKQELLNQGLDPKEATEAQKAMARLSIIMKGTTAAQGDAVRTAGGWSNQMKTWQAMYTDTMAAIGKPVMDMLADLSARLAPYGKMLQDWITQHPELVKGFALVGAGLVVVGGLISGLAVAAMAASVALPAIGTAIGLITNPFVVLTAAVGVGTYAWLQYTNSGKNALNQFQVGFENYKTIGLDAFRGIRAALESGDWGAAAEIAMLSIQGAWDQGIADLMAAWGDYITAIVETFAGAMQEIAKLWVSTQGGISKGILSMAENEGIVGDVMAKILGVDIRQQDEQTMDRQRSGLQYQLEEQQRQRTEAEAAGDTGAVAEWDAAIAETVAKLGDAKLGLGDLADNTAGQQARDLIDAQTTASQTAIDQFVGTALSRFENYTGDAAQRAEEARARLAERADQAERDLELKRAIEEAFVEPEPIKFDLPTGIGDGLQQAAELPRLATSSSYAVAAIASTGLTRSRKPEEETAKNTAKMIQKQDESIRAINNLERLGFA